jgi:hypothetical protein
VRVCGDVFCSLCAFKKMPFRKKNTKNTKKQKQQQQQQQQQQQLCIGH